MFLQSDYRKDRKKLDEAELWGAFRNGNRRALSELFLRHYSRLYRYGVKLISDREGVKDGIQQLFLRLWKKREEIDTAQSVELYLLISLRRILFRQKKQKASNHRRNREYFQTISDSSLSVEDKMISAEQDAERNRLFDKAFETLTDRQKEVLFLRLRHGLKNEEIAEVMDLSHQRIRNYINEATKRLKSRIFDYSKP